MGLSQKLARQREILRIVRTTRVETQTGLAESLRESGHPVSQPTLSKDIAELGLVKAPLQDGGYRYQLASEGSIDQHGRRLSLSLREFLVSWDVAGQIVVVKAIAGHAAGVAWALDNAKWPEIVGTVAGEDTVLVVSKTPAQAKRLAHRLEQAITT